MGLLVNPYAFGSGGGPAPAWVPTDLGSTLKGWWDADQQTESDGATVATFVNRAGSSSTDFVGSGNIPVLRHNRVNGKKALEFTNDLLQIGSGVGFMNGVSACSIFIALKGTADPQTSPADESFVNGFGTGGKSHFYTDGKWYESFGTNSRRDVNPPTSWASWRIAGVTSGNNDFKMWWDGTAIVTSGTNTVSPGNGHRRLGSSGDGSGGYFAGDIAELIICDTVLSTSDRQKVEGYMAHKYALTANLPGGHPYISSPP